MIQFQTPEMENLDEANLKALGIFILELEFHLAHDYDKKLKKKGSRHQKLPTKLSK